MVLFFTWLLIAVRSHLMCNLLLPFIPFLSVLLVFYLIVLWQMYCTLLCIIVTVSISVKIQRKVNKYDMICNSESVGLICWSCNHLLIYGLCLFSSSSKYPRRIQPTNTNYSKTCLTWPPTVPEKVVNISKWSTYTNVSQNNFYTRILFSAN